MAIVRVENLDGTFSEIDDSTLQSPKPVEEAGALRSLSDTLLKFGRGGANAVKAGTDALGANNIISRGAGNVADFLDSGISDEGKLNDQIAAQRLQLTQDQGIGAQLKAVGKNFLDNPIDTLAEGAGSILPTAAAMLLSKGKINPATVGTGLGVVQGAGAVKGSIYEATKQNALANGMTEQEADALATEAQAYSGENADQIGIGAGLGYLAGKTGAETSSLLTGQAKDNLGLLRNTLKGAATEGLTEGAQGGQEALAANLALQRQGEDVPLMRGVAGQAASEAVAGGLTGGAFGAADALTEQPQEQPKDPRTQLRDTLLAQNPTGALTQAAAKAVETGAADGALVGTDLNNRIGSVSTKLSDGVLGEARKTFGNDYVNELLYNYNIAQNPEISADIRGKALANVETMTAQPDFQMIGAPVVDENKKPVREMRLLPQQGGENVSNTVQDVTNVAENPNGQPDNLGTGSAGNILSQPSNTGTGNDVAETPTQGGNGDLPVRTADTSGNNAVKSLNELAIGESTKVGDATFRKTENGFERVENEQNDNVLLNEPKTPNDNLNDGQQGIEQTNGNRNAETSGITTTSPIQKQEPRAVDVPKQSEVSPESQTATGNNGNIRAESDTGALGNVTDNTLEKPQEIITKTPLDAQANEAATSPLNERAEPTQPKKTAAELFGSKKQEEFNATPTEMANDVSQPTTIDQEGSTTDLPSEQVKSRKKLDPYSSNTQERIDYWLNQGEWNEVGGGFYSRQVSPDRREVLTPNGYMAGNSKDKDGNWTVYDIPVAELRKDEQGRSFEQRVKDATKNNTNKNTLNDANSESTLTQNEPLNNPKQLPNQFADTGKVIDSLTDEQVIDVYKKANLAGANRTPSELRETLKAEDAKDIAPLIPNEVVGNADNVRDGIVDNGWTVHDARDNSNERLYRDKDGKRFATYEKDGVRVALRQGNTLNVERGVTEIYPSENNKDVIVEALIVDKDKRNQGRATKAMQEVTSIADQTQSRLYIEPAPLESDSADRESLIKFYEKNGFAKTDDSGRVMVREPLSTINTPVTEDNAQSAPVAQQPLSQKPKKTISNPPEFTQRLEPVKETLRAWIPDFDWNVRGGQIVRDTDGNVTGRTTWEAKDPDFNALRTKAGVPFPKMQEALNKAVNGEGLTKKERAIVSMVMDYHDEMMAGNKPQATQIAEDFNDDDDLFGTASQQMSKADLEEFLNGTTEANGQRESNQLAEQYDTSNAEVSAGSLIGNEIGTGTSGIGQNTPNEIAGTPKTNERQEARPLVEAIVKRRAAANQIGKGKVFDNYLAKAKQFLSGSDINPTEFKLASGAFKDEPTISNAFTQLEAMARAPRAEATAEKKSVVQAYKERIGQAQTAQELQSLAKEIQRDGTLKNAQATYLDNTVMGAIDALDSKPSISKTETVAENATGENIESLRKELRNIERDILLKAPSKMAVGGGDIESALKSPKVPKELKEKRAELKAKIRAIISVPQQQASENPNVATNDTPQERVDENVNERQEPAITRDQEPDYIAKELDIDAERIKNGYSHRLLGGTSGIVKIERESYINAVNSLYNDLLPIAKNDAQKEALKNLTAEFKQEYIKRRYRVMDIGSTVVSSLVAGRSNFNSKQASSRSNALDRAESEFSGWLKSQPAKFKAKISSLKTDEDIAEEKAKADEKAAKIKASLMKVMQDIDQFKSGDGVKFGSYNIARVSFDRDGYPSSVTVDATDLTDNKFDLAKTLFGGNKEKLRAIVDELRAEQAPKINQEAIAVEKVAQTPLSLYDNAMDEYNKGIANVDDYKAAFDYVLNNEKAITEYLEANFTKQQLFDRGGARLESRYKSEKKDRVARALYSDMVTDFILPSETGMTAISYGWGGDKYADIKRQVGEITQESLDKAMARLQEKIAERTEKLKERMAGIANPQTFEDFNNYLREKIDSGMSYQDARMTLTLEQRITLDNLAAEKSRTERKSNKEAQKTQVQATVTTTSGDIIETKHTKTGEPLFVVKTAERVEREIYNQWNATAKRMGGWYSSFRGNGAVAGFQFKTRENAEAFLKYLGGDVDQAKEAIQAKRNAYADDRSQTAVERLTEMADRLEADADEDLNRDRKTNTARRAGMAARAEANANANKAMAITMRNIAKAIQSGSAKYLDEVRQKTQVELLNTFVSNAQYRQLMAKYKSYAEYEKHKYDAPDNETADFAEFPTYTLFRSDWARLGRAMVETDGLKMIGNKILSVANDVTDAYIKFAKDNPSKVGVYVGTNLMPATFKTKAAAEQSIVRSGFNGKAIVIQSKRGEYQIIDSPQVSKEKGVWNGDNDKRITFSAGFINDVVEKIGKANRRQNKLEMPWQLELAYNNRKKLERMGIETPAEMRTALREFITYKEGIEPPSKIKELERSMIGRKNDGLDFFPTPNGTADAMIDAAEIEEGMNVLEPSAGMGHIADRLREAGFEPDVVEFNGDRRELLELKGFNVVGNDFMQFDRQDAPPVKRSELLDIEQFREAVRGDVLSSVRNALYFFDKGDYAGASLMMERATRQAEFNDAAKTKFGDIVPRLKAFAFGKYDRIIMNPPFSDRRDIAHVMHAYSLLKPKGRIVAIMGEGAFFGSDKKATEFRAWLESVGGTSEKLEEGTFNDPTLPVNTSVNARMVVIDKAENTASFSASPMKSVDANVTRGEQSMNEALLSKADVKRAMYHNELGWIDFVWGDNFKGIQHIIKQRMAKDGLTVNDVYKLLTKDLVDTIANGEVVKETRISNSENVRLEKNGYRAVLIRNKGNNGWLLTGFKLDEQVNQGRGATASDLRTSAPILTRDKVGAVQNELSAIASKNVNLFRATNQAPKSTILVDDVKAALKNDTYGHNIDIYPTVMDAPIEIQLQAMRERVSPEGFFNLKTGKVALILENIDSVERAVQVARHELVGHYGIESMLNDTDPKLLPKLLNQVTLIRRTGLNPVINEYSERVLDSQPSLVVQEGDSKQVEAEKNERIAKEVIAMMAEDNAHHGIVRQVLDAIRKFLKKIGFLKSDVTDAEITSLLRDAREYLKAGGKDANVRDMRLPALAAFSANQPVLFSARSPQKVVSDIVKNAANRNDVIGKAMTVLTGDSAKQFSWAKNIHTQLDKARKDPNGFGRMFNVTQRFETDMRLSAARPAELMPSIIAPSADTATEAINQVLKGDKSQTDKKAVASFLFEGTLAGESVLDGKVFTDDELTAKGATPQQIKMYREARATIDASLDETTAALAYNMVRKYLPNIKNEIRDNPSQARGFILDTLNEIYEDLQNFNEDNQDANDMKPLIESIEDLFDHTDALKNAGYMPLSRFGQYSVTAYDEDGSVAEFYRVETEAEAKLKEKELNRDYANVVRGVMPTNPNSIFAGADPDTVSLFLDTIRDSDVFDVNDELFQEWYRNGVSDRSALKRMIKRKGTAGFDTDLEKVLASFITSNSRFVAQNYNRADMLDVLNYLRTDPNYKRKGDVFDEAKALYDYVNNPADPFTFGRSIMFSWFMGGSIASAAVNMTQPFTMTMPWLSQFTGVRNASMQLSKAMKLASAITWNGKLPEGELGKALLKAREIGLVDPQEVHHLYKAGSGGIINKLAASKDLRTRLTGAATLWGWLFGKGEQFNRNLTFIAAWNVAKEKNMPNAFEFAKRAVEETQGIYDKTNRPNWARGTGSLGSVGAMAFTFKQYSIAYIEMLARMARSGKEGKKAALVALGVLVLLSGGMGLPFSDDGYDVLDTALQLGGGEGNTRRHIRELALDALGEELGMFALYGASAFMPFDIQGRMGMGNLIPSTAFLMPSNQENRVRSGMEILGAGGSLMSDVADTVQGFDNGKDAKDVLVQLMPVAFKNVFKGADMVSDGFYSDTRGRKVVETSEADALWKSIGFQPSSVASEQKRIQGNQQTISRVKQKESAIAEKLARARFDGDQEKANDALEELREWNEAHPDLPIVINPRQIFMRLRAMHMTRAERQAKATPRELRETLLQ